MNLSNKKSVVEYFKLGMFGNTVGQWDSPTEALATDCQLFSIRSRAKAGGGITLYNIKPEDLPRVWKECCSKVSEKNLYINACDNPDDELRIQGELSLTEEGLYVYYSDKKGKMKEAFAKGTKEAKGLEALMLLRANVDPGALDNMFEFLREYPDAVIEFSCWNVHWGTSNTMIWEVREY